MDKEILERLKKERPTYLDMMDWCCKDRIMNNYLYDALSNEYYFQTFCGSPIEYYDKDDNEITEEEYEDLDEEDRGYISHKEVYQYYIISEQSAKYLRDYTKELIVCVEEIDVYLLCVTHYGTHWSGVSATWKEVDDE